MTLMVGLGSAGAHTLAMLDDLLAMAVAPAGRPRPRLAAVVSGPCPEDFPGPIQQLVADLPPAWASAPWLDVIPGDSSLVHALLQAETDWRRILAADAGALHLVLRADAPEALLLDTLLGWGAATGRPVAVTWVGQGRGGGRLAPDGTAAACILLRDLMREPEPPLPPGTWTGHVTGHDRERVQAILEARLLEQLLELRRPEPGELLATWQALDPRPPAGVDPVSLASDMLAEGPMRGETMRAWLLAELDLLAMVREPGWAPPGALIEEARETLHAALGEDLWSGSPRPALATVDSWLELLEVVQTGIARRKEATDRVLEDLLAAMPLASGQAEQRLGQLEVRPGLWPKGRSLATDDVMAAIADIKPWWQMLETLREQRTRRAVLEDQGSAIDRMARSLQAWRAMVEREGLKRLRHLGTIIQRASLPALAEEHDAAVREALAMLTGGAEDPLREAAGGPGWAERLVGPSPAAVVPQVADLMGALTARAVRAAAMAATAPAGARTVARRPPRPYDPDMHPFTGHDGRNLRPGWQLSWGGKADAPPPETSPDDAAAIMVALATGTLRWAAHAFRILREDGRWQALAPGRHPLELPGKLAGSAAALQRIRELAAEGLIIPTDGERRRRRARQFARLLRTLQEPDAPPSWVGVLWARLEREGWPPLVLAESEHGRRFCPVCDEALEDGACPACGPVHGAWWAAG